MRPKIKTEGKVLFVGGLLGASAVGLTYSIFLPLSSFGVESRGSVHKSLFLEFLLIHCSVKVEVGEPVKY